MVITWLQNVWPLHQPNIGFKEGKNNKNPWTERLGIGDTSYCNAAISLVNYDAGVRWWLDSQFREKGFAYVPYLHQAADRHGCWMDDTTARRADLVAGDLVVFVWGGKSSNSLGDHIETVVAVYTDGTFDTIGYNTGSPEGCHYPIRRDRKYLLGRVRMVGAFYAANPLPGPPPAPGGTIPLGYGFDTTSVHHADWVELDGMSWILTAEAAIYAGPAANAAGAGMLGVNDQDYWLGPTHHAGPHSAAKLHVRKEGAKYVNCIQDTEGFLFRRDGGPTFTTH